MTTYKLSDGRVVIPQEKEFEGMAGEPMTVLQFTDEKGNMVNTADVKSMVSGEAVKEITEWVNYLSQANYEAAVSWVI